MARNEGQIVASGKQGGGGAIQRLKTALSAPSVQEQFQNALRDNSDLFVASLIDLVGNDRYLQECEPRALIMEALKAATLKLPINKSLGLAWIVAYKGVPAFQIGYRGYVQLALRTGQYQSLNADSVYEGELVGEDKLTGMIDLSGTATSDKVIGYFAYMKLLNGFEKTVYWTKEKIEAHAKRYSPAYNFKDSAWKTSFDAMAKKTTLRDLLGHYGIMSVEMMNVMAADKDDFQDFQDELGTNANEDIIDVDVEQTVDTPVQKANKSKANTRKKTETTGPNW